MQLIEQSPTLTPSAPAAARGQSTAVSQAISLLRVFGFLRTTALLGGLSFGTAVLSFISQWYVVTKYGVGNSTASYFAAMVLPVFLYEVFSVTLSFVLVPYFSTLSLTVRNVTAWTIVQGVGLVYLVVALLLFILAPVLIPVLFPGFDVPTAKLTVQLINVLLISLPFLTAGEVLAACYRANERFALPELCSMIGMAGGIALLTITGPYLGILAAAWSFVFRCVLEMTLLVSQMSPYHTPRWKETDLRLLWTRVKPLMIGACYYRTDALLDRTLTSFSAPGGLALLAFGRQLLHAGGRLLTRSVVMPMVPRLTNAARQPSQRDYWSILLSRVAAVSGLCLCGVLFTWIQGDWLLMHLFAGGAMTPEDVHVLRNLLLAMFGVVLGESVANLFTNAFYALHNTRIPTTINIVTFTIGIMLRLIGFWLGGIVGLALGLSSFYILYATALGLGLYWTHGMKPLSGSSLPIADNCV